MRRTVSHAAIVALLVGITGSSVWSVPAAQGGGARMDARPPDIVFILTDDQRWDSLPPDGTAEPQMPYVSQMLSARGMTLTNVFFNVALCCPSRASIMRGQYAQSTGVWNIDDYYGGYQAFHRNGDDISNVATWLQAANYHTGLIGKYLNGYGPEEAATVPPGWDTWRALTRLVYYKFSESVDGVQTRFGRRRYMTDVLREQALSFVDQAPLDQPMFLYWAPFAPHWPATPAPQDANACPSLTRYRPPSFNERDMSDKPPALRRPRMTRKTIRRVDHFHLRQCRSLQDVDRSVKAILDEISKVREGGSGDLSNTLIVYMSDNGISLGEHRIAIRKNHGYEEAIRSPFVARWDGVIPPGTTSDRLSANVDIAPTFADAAGVTPPYATDGRSLMPILRGGYGGVWRDAFLIEHGGGRDVVPPFCGVRADAAFTAGLKSGGVPFAYMWYFSTSGPNKELYDLAADPWELDNVARDPGYRAIVRHMQAWVESTCDPLPPVSGSPPAD